MTLCEHVVPVDGGECPYCRSRRQGGLGNLIALCVTFFMIAALTSLLLRSPGVTLVSFAWAVGASIYGVADEALKLRAAYRTVIAPCVHGVIGAAQAPNLCDVCRPPRSAHLF